MLCRIPLILSCFSFLNMKMVILSSKRLFYTRSKLKHYIIYLAIFFLSLAKVIFKNIVKTVAMNEIFNLFLFKIMQKLLVVRYHHRFKIS